MNGCGTLLIMLVIAIFLGALLMPETPIVGIFLIGLIMTILVVLCAASSNGINNNGINYSNKSNNYGNPIIPHIYRKQIRRFFKRR